MADRLATNHKRIWLQPLCCIDERCWCEDPQPCDDAECGLPAVEYIRADLVAGHAAMLAALKSLTQDPPATLDEPDPDWEVIKKMRAIARAAIAKAEGRG